MDSERYSEAEALCLLRELWPRLTGANACFDADTRLDTYLKSDGTWEEIDFLDVFHRLRRQFHFTGADNEWKLLLGFEIAQRSGEEWERVVAPGLTFGALARFIAERAPRIEFRPVTILGRECLPAGVFLAIERIVSEVRKCAGYDGSCAGFRPSSRILDVLRGSVLADFWEELRWRTGHGLPDLPPYWRMATVWTVVIGFAILLVSFVTGAATNHPLFLRAGLPTAAIVVLAGLLYRQFANPLPPRIRTFRDLAEWIAVLTANEFDHGAGR